MDEHMLVDVRGVKESFKRTRNPDGPDPVTGKYTFDIEITAQTNDVYIPLSIASGKKPTGFIYQIEGTVPGRIATTHISCKGEGVTQITFGTLVYCKIPAGMAGIFHIRIEMRGQVGKSYGVRIVQLNYKLDPLDTRYLKSIQDIHTRMLKFS